ncbi:hypothetical protein UFOVP1299_69 [uncultured Caudovirales phage]|uniref:Uncharacterized protein n=1 Tax=uncultured Caudovirales phage TaxID=2100421 RepID=A0A6J5RH83_9CAUD|nr:hypothetical protein UFOVP1299_69 [uncultured Caudovirales phage]
MKPEDIEYHNVTASELISALSDHGFLDSVNATVTNILWYLDNVPKERRDKYRTDRGVACDCSPCVAAEE